MRLGLTYDDVLLVPKRSGIRSRKDISIKTSLTREISLDIPIISANMDTVTESKMAITMAKLGGIGIIHRFLPIEKQAKEVSQVKNHGLQLLVGAAIGVRDDSIERAKALVSAGCDVLVLDIAHGHADHAVGMLIKIKKTFPSMPIIGGNVATCDGCRDLIKAGADCIKVGIGPGSMCTTRVIAGAGIPQLTAIMDCVREAKKSNIPLIADGGIKTAGDIAKAIAAGASTVMIGGLLAGTNESPAPIVMRKGKKYKKSRGMASLSANRDRTIGQDLYGYVAEGVEGYIPLRGEAFDVVNQLVGGLRSGMSYSGAATIPEFWKKAEFIKITQAGLRESHPHDVEVIVPA